MRRLLLLAYGLASYVLFLGVFLYGIGFVGGFLTPTSLDGAINDPQPQVLAQAVFINLALVAAFALQHSVMARPAFKRWLTRRVPEPIERSTYVLDNNLMTLADALAVPEPIERSTYVLATNIVLGVLYWQWRPMGGLVWHVEAEWARGGLWFLFANGWLTVLVTTCLINHFDLFGLRQLWLCFRGRPYTPLPFSTPGPYRLVRHPLYVGWLMAFWATPTMTVAHLVFAVAMTVYILMAIHLEERDLIAFHRAYADYRRRVPMLVPRWPMRKMPVADEMNIARTRSYRSIGIDHAVSTKNEESINETSTIQY